MFRTKALIFLFITTAAVLPVSARIGETPKQLQARYGEGKASADQLTWRFCKNGIYITAVLFKGTCQMISYETGGVIQDDFPKDSSKEKKDWSPGSLTEAQVESLKNVNAGNSPWKKSVTNQSETADGELVALWNPSRLEITTKEWINHVKEEEKKHEDGRVEGF